MRIYKDDEDDDDRGDHDGHDGHDNHDDHGDHDDHRNHDDHGDHDGDRDRDSDGYRGLIATATSAHPEFQTTYDIMIRRFEKSTEYSYMRALYHTVSFFGHSMALVACEVVLEAVRQELMD